MKKISICLIIVLCLISLAMPVIADKEDRGVNDDSMVTAVTTQTTSYGEQERRQGDDSTATVTATVTTTVTTTSRETPETERERTQSEIEERTRTQNRTIAEVREEHARIYGSLNATLLNISPMERERVRNENEVRLAVHTLLQMENLNGGIGRNVSAIARDFNNSARSAWAFEERIQNRNMFARILFGGDHDAAREIANLTIQNRVRIQEMQQLMNNATLDGEVRIMLEEQVRIMEKEQERLEQLAKREQEDRGFFGWFG